MQGKHEEKYGNQAELENHNPRRDRKRRTLHCAFFQNASKRNCFTSLNDSAVDYGASSSTAGDTPPGPSLESHEPLIATSHECIIF